jgi:hypothetical protein
MATARYFSTFVTPDHPALVFGSTKAFLAFIDNPTLVNDLEGNDFPALVATYDDMDRLRAARLRKSQHCYRSAIVV